MPVKIPMLLMPWAHSTTTQFPICSRSPITRLARERWIEICATRLGEIGHYGEGSELTLLATALWADVGLFDPTIAAEIEHESWAACS